MKDKIVAAFLAWFLGIFGGHRFYLGQTGKGILYLLFCWTPVVWIASVIDFIHFLIVPKEKFDAKYNPQYVKNSSKPGHIADELDKLSRLMDKNLITFEEFEKRKALLLDN